MDCPNMEFEELVHGGHSYFPTKFKDNSRTFQGFFVHFDHFSRIFWHKFKDFKDIWKNSLKIEFKIQGQFKDKPWKKYGVLKNHNRNCAFPNHLKYLLSLFVRSHSIAHSGSKHGDRHSGICIHFILKEPMAFNYICLIRKPLLWTFLSDVKMIVSQSDVKKFFSLFGCGTRRLWWW